MKWFRRQPQAAPWLIVGLGNPGGRYARNRHNIGFMVVDRWAERHGLDVTRKRSFAILGEGKARLGDEEMRVIAAKPRMFMNESGPAVRELIRRYHGRPERAIVVYDDMDLPLGRTRLRERGSAGGHKGIASIITSLGTEAFNRLRVGIGRPGEQGGAVEHVLGDFSDGEAEAIDQAIARAADALDWALTQGVPSAMNEFNG